MTLTTTLARAAQPSQKTPAVSGEDTRTSASASTTDRASATPGRQDTAPARRPFADVLEAQRPTAAARGDQAGTVAGADAATADASDQAAGTGVAGLPQGLPQAMADLLAADTPALAVPDLHADGEESTTDDQADATATDTAQPLLSLLMPTLFPTVMPPAPAQRGDGSQGAGALPTSSTTSDIGAAAAGASTLSGAVVADAAQLLSVKAQTAGGAPADAGLSGADVAMPQSSATDGNAWAGLQRWSAALMEAPVSGTATGTTPTTSGSDTSLAMPANRQEWQNSLMQALGDKLQLQSVLRGEQARLHLVPPQLGRIEIDIRQQGGALQVQMVATHDEVRQQLRQIAEPLRQDLVQRHSGDVSVQVASGAQAAGDGRGRDGAAGGQNPQGQAGGQRDAQRQPGRALADDDSAAVYAFGEALARQGQA